MAGLEERRTQAIAIQGNGAMVQPEKFHGDPEEAFDEEVADDLFFRQPVGEIVEALNQMDLEFQGRGIGALTAR
ncbi:hypothetical protein D3C75_934530 [compost metagenome]